MVWHKSGTNSHCDRFTLTLENNRAAGGSGAAGFAASSRATGPSNKRPSAIITAVEHSTRRQRLPDIGDVFNHYGMFTCIWIPESLLKCPDISPSAKLLYGRLARFAVRRSRGDGLRGGGRGSQTR